MKNKQYLSSTNKHNSYYQQLTLRSKNFGYCLENRQKEQKQKIYKYENLLLLSLRVYSYL